MLGVIHVGFAGTMIIIGVLALVMFVFIKPLFRWGIYALITYILLLIASFIDPFELAAKAFISNASPVFNLILGLESIVVDSLIAFVAGGIMLPKGQSTQIKLTLLIGGLCTYNLWKFSSFTLLPIGLDNGVAAPIDWWSAIANIVAFCVVSWIFIGGEDKSDVPVVQN